MGWARRATKPIPPMRAPVATYEIDDYSLGMNSFLTNDTIPLKSGQSNFWRLAQDARITALGEYSTRKGFDFHSSVAGQTQDDTETSTTGASNQGFNELTRLAQKFVPTVTGPIPKVDVNLKNDAGATGVVIVEIWDDDGGAPGTMLAQSSLDTALILTSYSYLTVRLPDAPTLTSSSTYWIVIYVQSAGTGSYYWSTTTHATDSVISTDAGGTWSANAFALNFRAYYSTTGAIKGLHRAYKSDGTVKTLFAHGTVLYSVNDATGALTTVKSGLNASATAYRFVTVNDIVYYVNGYDGLRKWDFTTESQVNATNYSLICLHKGLLFLALTSDPNKVVYSNFADYEVYTSTDFVYAPAPKTGDPVTALESLNGYLLMFTVNNKFILSGVDTDGFQLDEAPDQKGTPTQETVTADQNYVYYLSDDGVYRSNGTDAQLMSRSIYQDVLALQGKEDCCIGVNRGRLYLWYTESGDGFNSKAWVWNLNYGKGYDVVESQDTTSYVARCFSCFNDDDQFLVASSKMGQVYWLENNDNDYTNAGGAIYFELRTNYLPFGQPSANKQIRQWWSRFAAATSDYDVTIQAAYNLADSPDDRSILALHGDGYLWGASDSLWGSMVYGVDAEIQGGQNVPGEWTRIQLRYKHHAARQPVTFYGHSIYIQTERLRF